MVGAGLRFKLASLCCTSKCGPSSAFTQHLHHPTGHVNGACTELVLPPWKSAKYHCRNKEILGKTEQGYHWTDPSRTTSFTANRSGSYASKKRGIRTPVPASISLLLIKLGLSGNGATCPLKMNQGLGKATCLETECQGENKIK